MINEHRPPASNHGFISNSVMHGVYISTWRQTLFSAQTPIRKWVLLPKDIHNTPPFSTERRNSTLKEERWETKNRREAMPVFTRSRQPTVPAECWRKLPSSELQGKRLHKGKWSKYTQRQDRYGLLYRKTPWKQVGITDDGQRSQPSQTTSYWLPVTPDKEVLNPGCSAHPSVKPAWLHPSPT